MIQNTGDGSQTIYSEIFKETYHSVNGAITESMHVFINAGFHACAKNPLRIFEVGFGTGLNALLTVLEARKQRIHVEYHSIELFPIDQNLYQSLDYTSSLSINSDLFTSLHATPWDKQTEILPGFVLKKIQADLVTVQLEDRFDVIYFDAFSPVTQSELWTEEIFGKLYKQMNDGGILTTYCAKGIVRRTLEKVGFKTERLPGPPGKREMLRAIKIAI